MAEEKKAEAAAANEARRKEQEEQNDAKKRMKGKNKPSRRQKKKQTNIIEVGFLLVGSRVCSRVLYELRDTVRLLSVLAEAHTISPTRLGS